MASPALMINARYQVIGKPVGQGGMGIVYRAYDVITKRHVALKTMRGALNPTALDLFSKEWTVLAGLSHPNIVDILDTGDFEEDGRRKPFFVMPFLPGATLEYLIENASQRLTVERIIEITAQTCRGLQAAHEHGLIHRDLKPSNIFVMEDDTVKIIDFGVVHLAGAESVTGLKGTLQYMAPEQIDMKPASPASDIFSLGVVCYETLTGRKPFARKTEHETVEAIRRHTPPPISDLNPLVSQLVGRVVHKAMAKQPWHRFSSAREYADTLQKALQNQPIERFDRVKIQPRIERAKKAAGEGDHQFALEILSELEAEGHVDPEITVLRLKIDHAVRQKSIRQLLDSARIRLEDDEFPLALQKIQEVLDLDPENADAQALRGEIEKQRSERQLENWFRIAEQHIHNQAFDQARQALQEILKIDPTDTKARDLFVQVDQREQEISRRRAEKEQLYQAAVSSYQQGEISSALIKLERVLELSRRSPESSVPDRDAQYQNLYNQIRTERETALNCYAEGRRYLADRNFGKAIEICSEYLKTSPGNPMFQALKLEAEEQQRQEQSAFIAEVGRRVEAEPDLDRRVNILKEAVERYPNEVHFQQSLRLIRERRDLVNSIVNKARQYEERGQYNEALGQMDILRNIYAPYPGIDFEVERLMRRRDEAAREEAKGRCVEQIDQHIAAADYTRALDLIRGALAEYPNDRELAGLERFTQQALARAAEAQEWLTRGEKLCFDRQFGEGLEALRRAAALDDRNPVIRAALLNALVEQARALLGHDWRAAEPLIQEALGINSTHPQAKSLQGLVLDYRRQEALNDCTSQARELQAAGDLAGALRRVEETLAAYPNEMRLLQLQATLRKLAGVAPPPPEAQPQGKLLSELPAPDPVSMREPASSPGVVSTGDTTSLFGSGSDRTVTTPVSEASGASIVEPRPETHAPAARPARSRWAAVAGWAKRVAGFLQSLAESRGRMSRLQKGFIIGAPALILLALLMAKWPKPADKPAAPSPVVKEVAVGFDAYPAGVTVLLDGKMPVTAPVRLGPGAHTLEGRLPGYKTDVQTVNVSAGMPPPQLLHFRLEPAPASLRVSSGPKAGAVVLDDQTVPLQEGTFARDDVGLTEHTFRLTQAGRETLSFSFKAEAAAVPAVTTPVKGREMDAVVVTGMGAKARIYSSNRALKAGGDGQPLQAIPAEGLEVDIPGQNVELTLDDGKNSRRLSIERTNAPLLSVWMTDVNTATIQVEANVADADLIIDGKKRRTLKSLKGLLNVAPGVHTVVVSKEGYEPGQEQKVELKSGEVRTLQAFVLKPIVRTAILAIDGATADAEVWIDGQHAGGTGADGSYRREGLSPEPHTIVLRKAKFEPKQLPPKPFAAGQTVSVSGAEGQLTPFGSLVFRIVPEAARITYQRDGDPQLHRPQNGETVAVQAGRYAVEATAPGRTGRQQSVTVDAGRPTTVTFTLPPVAEPKKEVAPPPVKLTNEYFEDPASWKLENGLWFHRGDGTSYLRGRTGLYEFAILPPGTKKVLLLKLKKKIEWVIDEKSGDRVSYTIDSGWLSRRATVKGKPDKSNSTQQVPIVNDTYVIRMEIRPDSIVISSSGKVLDEYKRPNAGEPPGRFGFKGEVGLVIRHAEER